MASIPGYTLEDYVAWNWNLVVEGSEDPNISVMVAEMLGNLPTRPVLTQEEFETILVHYEPWREAIENSLDNYDEEDHGSWRSYGCYVEDVIDKQTLARIEEVVAAVKKTKGN